MKHLKSFKPLKLWLKMNQIEKSNVLDEKLGKFEHRVDEGILLGYSS